MAAAPKVPDKTPQYDPTDPGDVQEILSAGLARRLPPPKPTPVSNVPYKNPANPEMQAAVDAIGKAKAYEDTAPSIPAAGTMALSGGDVAASEKGDLEKKGHAKPSETPTPPPAQIEKPTAVATPTKSVGPVVGTAAAPGVKDIVQQIMTEGTPPAKSNEKVPTWQDYLKEAGGKFGDFLQRWGYSLAGAPGAETQGDIKRRQEFELKKQQTAEQVANQYQVQRMQLQNQMNIANLPIEKKAELENQMKILDAQFQQQLKLLPLEIQKNMAMRQWLPGADPSAHVLDQGK
jgi:hypothetical protein